MGGLLENTEWRHNLYQRRLGAVSPAIVRIGEWFQGRFESVWQAVEEIISPQQAVNAWRTRSSLTNQSQSPVFDVSRVKVLDFGSQLGSEQVALLIGVSAINDTEVTIGLQIRPTGEAIYLPNEVQVRLLNENGNEEGQASASVTQTIELQFGGQQGDRFS